MARLRAIFSIMLEGSILHQLRLAHQSASSSRRPLNFGVYYKNTLVALCHALEDCILTANSAPLVVTAFQRGKWYLQEADRYADLADHSRQIVIMATAEAGFADHPTSQKPVVDLVALDPADPVAQEWHLIILAPTYSAMVLCQELSPEDYGVQGVPTNDLERKFYGFWTFESNLVQETLDLAIAHIQTYDGALAETLVRQMQAILAEASAERDDLGLIVSRVVEYLQTTQTSLPPTVASQLQMLDNNLVSNEVQAFLRMAQLSDQADLSNPLAAAEVAALVEAMGQVLDVPVWQLHRLKLAGLLHRLAPLQHTPDVLQASPGRHHADDPSLAAPACALVPGAQVLRRMPQLRAIATIITHQAEYWNGQGQPAGLAGDEIPLESRILGLVAEFQHRLAHLRTQIPADGDAPMHPSDCLTQALQTIQQEQGDRWDPKLVETLALIVNAMQQGMNLAVSMPKISAGLWLVDSHCGDQLL